MGLYHFPFILPAPVVIFNYLEWDRSIGTTDARRQSESARSPARSPVGPQPLSLRPGAQSTGVKCLQRYQAPGPEEQARQTIHGAERARLRATHQREKGTLHLCPPNKRHEGFTVTLYRRLCLTITLLSFSILLRIADIPNGRPELYASGRGSETQTSSP
jgi:hypothetical protein